MTDETKDASESPLDWRVRGWQPIGTSPKDGVLIIVSDGESVSVGWWHGEGWANCLPVNSKPTHWMPLPEAPNAELRGRALFARSRSDDVLCPTEIAK